MKNIVIGILAHVDAGKTTLSEGMLYVNGSIKRLGRVDAKSAFLDTHELEKARGITIFSKQAVFELGNARITLLDTPGHIDFSAEMERTLQVLDYAILVISGADGVQGHTQTLWRLLDNYKIPVFIFVNKMDQNGTDKDKILKDLKEKLDEDCIDFEHNPSNTKNSIFQEDIALRDEHLLEIFLESGILDAEDIKRLILERKIFPCFFGSALKLDGVEGFLKGLNTYVSPPSYSNSFGAKVFKIGRDELGNRLTFMKITGGSLKVKAQLTNKVLNVKGDSQIQQPLIWEEKVNQIRIYSGEKYTVVNEAENGWVCAVTGLNKTYPGQGLGVEDASFQPILEPVLTYSILLPQGCEPGVILPKLRQLEEEEPELHIVWNETLQEIQAQIMGEIQIEILRSLILKRFGVEVEFGTGNILYKETIEHVVEGVGHFEPLRHYAEVHLILEPGKRGSGLAFNTDCSEDLLDRSWQRLVLAHLKEKEHKGVLTGSPITDIKFTLVTGRAHLKHTEGGDFRQATYRAVRQGLKEAKSLLLEPYYDFTLEVPENMVGRAMTDIERMHGTFETQSSRKGTSVLTGSGPVLLMRYYHQEVMSYTKGFGTFFCSLKGYQPCHNAQEIIEKVGYDSERDTEHPTGSVFCAHGAGFTVNWDRVKEHMHLECVLQERTELEKANIGRTSSSVLEEWIDDEEVEAIMAQTYFSNKRDKSVLRKGVVRRKPETALPTTTKPPKKVVPNEEYLLVDGYNIIFAWEELKELAGVTFDGARGKLLDIVSNYQGIRKCKLMVVFDAYKLKNHNTEIHTYDSIQVVYTKEGETADQYIERFVYENSEKYNITIATSDGLEQMIIRGKGCRLLSAREFKEEIQLASENLRREYLNQSSKTIHYFAEFLPDDI